MPQVDGCSIRRKTSIMTKHQPKKLPRDVNSRMDIATAFARVASICLDYHRGVQIESWPITPEMDTDASIRQTVSPGQL